MYSVRANLRVFYVQPIDQHASCKALLARERNVHYSVCLLFFPNIMMQKISEVVVYEKRLRGMPFVPGSSYGRGMLREDGGPNKTFFTYLFCDRDMGIQFMKDVGLLWSKV